MTVAIGNRLGPYEIVSRLGAGGMGEVWRARDTRLDRSVAVKILPAGLAHDPQFRLRFEREAKTISQLSHPNICQIYDVGREHEVDYLVMELLEGESLAARIAKGPLPIRDALRYGAEVADALGKAHRHGVIHRDLKPANVMLTRSGAKLLDFGLAKPAALRLGPDDATTARPLTEQGTVVGTLQYMAPEQLGGDEVDARADIFALGAVLFEMVTGRRAFEGSSRLSIVSKIVGEPSPRVSSLAPSVTPALDHIVAQCLVKDPDQRWQCAADLKFELLRIQDTPATEFRHSGRSGSSRVAWIVALTAVLASIIVAVIALRPGEPPGPVRFTVSPPPGWTFSLDLTLGPPAVSPDGRYVAFSASEDATGRVQLWVRDMDITQPFALGGTDGATFVFWSPDSRSLGFFADGYLKRTDLKGGSPQALCPVAVARGGSWSSDDVIIFAPSADGPLFRVNASGGAPQQLTQLDRARRDSSHRWPYFLPDGKHFLFLIRTQSSRDQPGDEIYAANIESPAPRRVFMASSNISYSEPGYLLYMRDRTLLAQRFSLKTLQVEGSPAAVSREPLQYHPAGFGLFSCSRAGVLAIGPGSLASTLQWVDRSGRAVPAIAAGADYASVRLSPDGQQILYGLPDVTTGNHDNWVYDIARHVSRRVTFHPRDDFSGILTGDGKHMIFSSNRLGSPDLYIKAMDAADETLMFPSPSPDFAEALSPDGRVLLFRRIDPNTRNDIMTFPVGGGTPAPFVRSSFDDLQPAFSPGGDWVAYVSNESGRHQVYVVRFPVYGSRVQISTEGGTQPTWRGDGKELFYVAPGNRMISVPIDLSSGIPRPAATRELFRISLRPARNMERQYDVSPDGQRFLMNVIEGERHSLPLTVSLHWQNAMAAK
ncbi:MAG TPA: protein kinase [Thermoanaerobaculia bacterium]|nr:protein kinase [Thermoanaerobaculia bacterium]